MPKLAKIHKTIRLHPTTMTTIEILAKQRGISFNSQLSRMLNAHIDAHYPQALAEAASSVVKDQIDLS
jgi:hypothetical protein